MEAVVFIVFAVVAVVMGIFAWQASQQRKKDLAAWAQAKGLRYNPGSDRSMDARYGCFSCLLQGSNRYAYNLIEGGWNGRELLAFDYHYETYSHDKNGRKTHHHHFSALILQCHLPLKPLFIRPEGFFDKITEFFGYDDIDFESAEFSRKFYVKAADKRWAYDVIHQRTMEFLLAQPRFTLQFEGPYVIAYRGSKFGVPDFATAADTIAGVVERFPEYLLKQLKEGA